MAKYVHEALGTKLIIEIFDHSVYIWDINAIFKIVDTFESNYSRFKKNNILHTLNCKKEIIAPIEFLSLVQLAQKISKMTQWYFDISVLPLLENIWYGIKKEKIPEHIGYKHIEIQEQKILLHKWIQIEIWALGKGYLVDLIYNILNKKYKQFIINFGGDIRISGEKIFFLEDPLKETKAIWEIILENLSLAGSNPKKRKTSKWTHLINPKKKSIDQKKAVFTTHKLAVFADIFSTALFVSPLKMSIDILEKTQWLEWMIIAENGEIYQSHWFKAKLYI